MSYKFLGEAVAQSIADAIKSLRSGKVDKVSGKALSTNDYTTEEKNKLAGIAAQANKITVDTSITSGGTNPVTGGAIYTALSGKLGTSGDSKNNTVTFTSSDTTDANATSWTSVSQLTSGISHATFFNRASQMFKNVRYLYKLLGTADISSLGSGTYAGTVTGALNKLNTDSYQYKGTLSSADNLNNVTRRGFYAITTAPANCPATWSLLVVSVSGATIYHQIFGSAQIYQRAFTGNPAAWTEWKSPTLLRDLSQNASYDTTKINEASDPVPRLFVQVVGKTVNIRGEFEALTDISNQFETIATGLPAAITQTSGTFFGINQTTGKPICLGVSPSGSLNTYYVGAISAGDFIRFSGTYFTT